MRDLGTLGGGGHSQAKAINNRGEVVGWSDARSGHYAFRWQNGRMSRLGTRESGAAVINDRGQIAGRVRSGSGTWHAFLWQSGRMRDLGARVFERPVAINDRGQMIGNSGGHAFVWQAGRTIDLGSLPRMRRNASMRATAINDDGYVVGMRVTPRGTVSHLYRAVLWTPQ